MSEVPPAPGVLTGKTVIVDDSPVLVCQLQCLLQALDFDAAHCAEPAQLAGQRPAYVFVELLQLEHNGFCILRMLRGTLDCPLILISGTGRPSDLHWGRQAGATHVLTRPLQLENIREVLHGHPG